MEKEGANRPDLAESQVFRVYREPRLLNPYLLVGWNHDAGHLGAEVMAYLRKETQAQECAEIEPLGFFSLAGVAMSDDVVQFPTSKFFACESHDLLFFESLPPQEKPYAFLNLVLDIAQHFHVREICIFGGLASRTSHTSRRRILTVVNRPELKEALAPLGLETGMNYQGPPSMNSFLLWTARHRNLGGVTLWEEIPFYLAAVEDWRAIRTMLRVLEARFGLPLNLTPLDEEAKRQDDQIELLRQQQADIDSALRRLEKGGELTEEESQKLAMEVRDFLRQNLPRGN